MSSSKNELTQSLLAECRINDENLKKIGADIRNKLSPIKNLISLIRRQREFSDTSIEVKEELQKLINSEINQCEKSIKYLSELL